VNGRGHSGTKQFTTTVAPALATQYYGMNAMRPPFNDVRVRRAFALAIDRAFLADSVLHGTATKADHGLVPPGLAGYPYDLVPRIPFDPDSARRLMALAGYPNGRGFPHVQLQVNNDGFGYQQVAGKVQDMLLKELKVPISVSVVSPKEYYDRIERGKALFWREGWVADLPDPRNFLALLYGKNAVADTALPSPLNTTRYMDPRFDSLYAASMAENDVTARYHALAEAERIAMKDVPLIPLYHPCYILLAEPQVQDLHINPMELIDLRAVWFSAPQTKLPATNS
jgi:ABC-type transport system substrate-binding protein